MGGKMERMNSETQKNCWEFLPFRLDKANATLWRDDKVVPLRPKSFAYSRLSCHENNLPQVL